MNTTNITKQITAFRALSTEAAITPENLGVILQALADLLSAAATNTDLQSLTAWKANLLKLSTLLQSISLGTVGTDKVCLSVIQGNTASGVLQRQADNIILKAATTAEADGKALGDEAIRKVNTNYSQYAVAMKYIEAYNQAMALKRYKL